MKEEKKTAPGTGEIRKDFPILEQTVYGRPLVYLDNAASSQMPVQVVNSLSDYCGNRHANVHRGVHYLSAHATELFEQAREQVRSFIHAAKREEIIFTSGTTQSINMLAASFGRQFVKPGDEIIISAMEHHSNIVPWQMMCEEREAVLRILPVQDNGELESGRMEELMGEKTRLISITHVSNTLGTVNPVKELIKQAHERSIPVLLDGAQAVPHLKVDVQYLDCDFYAFSGHKMYAPTGIGVLYGKEQYLEKMPPVYGGGEMIGTVTFEKTTYNELPYKFEAGTPNILGAVGLKSAIDYMKGIGMDAIKSHEQALLNEAESMMSRIEGLHIIGKATNKTALVSFVIDHIHPYDAGTLLDKMGIAVRTGHHCTEPLMKRYNIPGTIRASFAFYNTFDEINKLVEGILKVKKIFGT